MKLNKHRSSLGVNSFSKKKNRDAIILKSSIHFTINNGPNVFTLLYNGNDLYT